MAVAATRPVAPSAARVSKDRRSIVVVISTHPSQPTSTVQGIKPALRLPIAENAAGVRSMIRLEAHAPPQQARSPQNRSVCGPQSAIDVTTREPLHRLVVECRNPQVRRVIPVIPQRSGLVISRHAADVFGQACWKLPE
jgi:hypothetical protein